MKTTYLSLAAGALLLAACTPKPAVAPDAVATKATPDVPAAAAKPEKLPEGGKPERMSTVDVSYMDKTVRPQDDFFRFANGTWCKNNPVPASESRWGSFNELDQRNKKILHELLVKATGAGGAAGSQEQLLGDYFTAYCDMQVRNKLGIIPLEKRLASLKQLNSRKDIVVALAGMHRVGINSLFRFGVGQDMKDVQRNISYLSQGGIGLPNKDYYTADNKKRERDAYKAYIAELFVLSGSQDGLAEKQAEKVFAFEKKLADSMMAPAELRSPEKTYNKMHTREAWKLLNQFDMDTYLSQVGSQTFDSVVVGQVAYLRRINQLMKDASMDEWSAYLSFKYMNHYAGMLSDEWVTAKFNFYQRTLSGKSEMKPIHERAIDEITGSALGELLGKAFVESNYSAAAQKRVNEMVDNLLISFKRRIEQLEWMSPATKKEALIKLNSIGRKLGFPEQWRDYRGLAITKDDYVTNVDNCMEFEISESFAKLYKRVNRKEWEMPAHLVNAYYHPLLNEIAFPAGIMQPPFFSETAEDAVNYGRIGMVIGHEFTHGFDDEGSKFAADGSFTNWWSEEDRKLFEDRTKTLGETFSGFCPVDGHCVNPDLTMGENIADLGGLTLAYYAYTLTEEFKSGTKREGFTPAQRFFIAYAQLWKINYTEEELKNRIANDPHSPGMYRVNGPLMNCPEFFEAFDVKEGDKMRNATPKVAKIW